VPKEDGHGSSRAEEKKEVEKEEEVELKVDEVRKKDPFKKKKKRRALKLSEDDDESIPKPDRKPSVEKEIELEKQTMPSNDDEAPKNTEETSPYKEEIPKPNITKNVNEVFIDYFLFRFPPVMRFDIDLSIFLLACRMIRIKVTRTNMIKHKRIPRMSHLFERQSTKTLLMRGNKEEKEETEKVEPEKVKPDTETKSIHTEDLKLDSTNETTQPKPAASSKSN
jgi:hypothetical protein